MKYDSLIIGSGPCAFNIAEELLKTNMNMMLVCKDQDDASFKARVAGYPDSTQLKILQDAEVMACSGQVGRYNVILRNGQKTISQVVKTIIVAEKDDYQPNFASYQLKPNQQVLSFSAMQACMPENGDEQWPVNEDVKHILFLNGIASESVAHMLEDMMRLCLRLQSSGNIQTYIFTRNLKVAGNGIESLYHQTKDAGTLFIKFTTTSPEIVQTQTGDVQVSYQDEITGQLFQLQPDLTVVDETIKPNDTLTSLGATLGLKQDSNGFLQTDNVHRLNVLTNRKGIFTMGPSRSIMSSGAQRLEARNAAAAVVKLLNEDLNRDEDNKAAIDTSVCVKCLTCLRLCPYKAIELNPQPIVTPEACEGCSICVAECPALAIQMMGMTVADMMDRFQSEIQDAASESFEPQLACFCCSRSAARAKELAEALSFNLPAGLRIAEVPCAGAISLNHILSTLRQNVDAIIVLTCHPDNCHSEVGQQMVNHRIARIQQLLPQIGLDPERLMIRSLASNMGAEFAHILAEQANIIRKIGPNPIKGSH